jgi:hypothetical protein
MPTEELSNRSCAFADLFSYSGVFPEEHFIASSPEWLLINYNFVAEFKCQKHTDKSQQLGIIPSHFQLSPSSQPISLTVISFSALKVNVFVEDPPSKFHVHFLSPHPSLVPCPLHSYFSFDATECQRLTPLEISSEPGALFFKGNRSAMINPSYIYLEQRLTPLTVMLILFTTTQ